MKGWSIIFEKGLVFITRRKSQKGESFYLHRCPPGKFFRRPNYSLASFNVILQTCFLVFFFVFFFSYVRDATAAMFVAFCLFVFPSQKPMIFTPDGSGKMG